MTPGGAEFSYDFRVLSVVENQPFSLAWLTISKPIQAWWFDQWLATVVSMVEKREIGRSVYTAEIFNKEWLFSR